MYNHILHSLHIDSCAIIHGHTVCLATAIEGRSGLGGSWKTMWLSVKTGKTLTFFEWLWMIVCLILGCFHHFGGFWRFLMICHDVWSKPASFLEQSSNQKLPANTKNQKLKPANQELKSANQKLKSNESETKNRANQKQKYRNQIQNPANQKLRISFSTLCSEGWRVWSLLRISWP